MTREHIALTVLGLDGCDAGMLPAGTNWKLRTL